MLAPDEVFTAAQGFNPAVQIELITKLWQALPPESWPTPSDKELSQVQRRTAEERAGRLETIGWDKHYPKMMQRFENE